MDEVSPTQPGNFKEEWGPMDDVQPVFSTGVGINEETIQAISRAKHEPQWMLDLRLQAYQIYQSMPMPIFGPDLSEIDLNEIKYFQRATDHIARNWEDVPDEIKTTFERIGVPEAERKYLAGSAAQYESEAVYHNLKQDLESQGIIFMDTDSALKQHPELVRQYFGKLIAASDNKFAALNTAVWSGGTFLYVPKNVHADVPIQSYFRINAGRTGQFERTLIIVDEGGSVNYVEGCTAPNYAEDSLHAAVVEVLVKKDAYCRYTTIQNWSTNVYSLETKRAQAEANSTMEWVDGNLGSKVTMKYPSIYLTGAGATGSMLSIAAAGANMHQDTGANMIHLAPNTHSTIVSKAICHNGGRADYRGLIKYTKAAKRAKSHVECDTILMDQDSASDTFPVNDIETSDGTIEHEAHVSKISEAQLYYLKSRGLDEATASQLIIMGFLEPFTKQLPMEYAVELDRLIKFQMEGSIG
ncbi:Fe-S cluster assembly protein SufB [Pediococcus acidilactici]|uniref:Fe-S cluster assembly protein SufB n=1 Tax=Pediococcus acidilactici TaxID=1254 RepID=UPI0013294158|nr:Fe-S cluster assembly protein SufB [Pediococcus acidilactici]KAF0335601.1 Fe-S cluster assembly protein SufB [Pediococcus acidilactici]KAF0345073.1 Fe-S cluster assembly protein SufB [Pediococcus acidilactici]KAF0354438.1 Fe-S cluster assembly protein SufB [Pediococcus acidilactici]KAF0358484.1 Fe-S cluster assembly protein SufB [Pediococcus acidilactici]KAF0362914.1 Fe-S cluster assembly protein SufB [Pediococcus acidilactici]